MDETKKWYQSRTIIAALVGVAVNILGATTKLNIDDETTGMIVDVFMDISNVVVFIAAIYGRVHASTTIEKKPVE